jgi:hypothetical protein
VQNTAAPEGGDHGGQSPQDLPDDLYDYGDDPAPPAPRRRNPSPDTFDVEKLPVIDDWPERVPVTEAEVTFSSAISAMSSTGCSGRLTAPKPA